MHFYSDREECIASIREKLNRLGTQIESGDESQLVVWVIESNLACCHRPLRYNCLYGGSARFLDTAAKPLIEAWMAEILRLRFRSVLCLMSPEEVNLYRQIEFDGMDLLEYYEHAGLRVSNIPWKDPHHVRSDRAALQKKTEEVSKIALENYHELPKPVLLHCSAGIDRSAPVAGYIWEAVGKDNVSLPQIRPD